MFAIFALILHLAGGDAGKHVTDFELAGLICVSLQLLFSGWAPWLRHP